MLSSPGSLDREIEYGGTRRRCVNRNWHESEKFILTAICYPRSASSRSISGESRILYSNGTLAEKGILLHSAHIPLNLFKANIIRINATGVPFEKIEFLSGPNSEAELEKESGDFLQ